MIDTQAMSSNYFEIIQNLKNANKPFALATVISVKGSASAKPGSKAIFSEEGKNLWGWVGGGCAESFVAKNAMESMQDWQTRIVEADLDDEIFGLGMPCGGIMNVYIEPQKPIEKITLKGPIEISEIAKHLGSNMGFETHFEEVPFESKKTLMEEALYGVAQAIALSRDENFQSLKKNRQVFPEGSESLGFMDRELSEVLIVGSSRITEEMARLSTILKWNVRVYGWSLEKSNYPESAILQESDAGFSNFSVKENSAVLVASHHKGDHEFIQRAIKSGASYVGLIASAKRSGILLEHLKSLDMPQHELSRVHAPAGLEMKCKDPQEIALSALAEIIELKYAQ